MQEILFKVTLAALLLVDAGIRLYYERGRREFEKAVAKHERREKLFYALVTNGPYRFIRHPMYAAIFLIGIGISLHSANWIVALAYLLPVTGMYLFRISDEEEMMIEQFGDEYREYMRRTGRLVPKLIALKA